MALLLLLNAKIQRFDGISRIIIGRGLLRSILLLLLSPPLKNFGHTQLFISQEKEEGVLERNRCLTGLRRGGQELKWGKGTHLPPPPLFSRRKEKGKKEAEREDISFSLKKSPRKNVEVVFLAQNPRGKTSCRRSRERQGRTSGGAIFVVHRMVFFCTKSREWEKRGSSLSPSPASFAESQRKPTKKERGFLRVRKTMRAKKPS